jgi:hypothetical protein
MKNDQQAPFSISEHLTAMNEAKAALHKAAASVHGHYTFQENKTAHAEKRFNEACILALEDVLKRRRRANGLAGATYGSFIGMLAAFALSAPLLVPVGLGALTIAGLTGAVVMKNVSITNDTQMDIWDMTRRTEQSTLNQLRALGSMTERMLQNPPQFVALKVLSDEADNAYCTLSGRSEVDGRLLEALKNLHVVSEKCLELTTAKDAYLARKKQERAMQLEAKQKTKDLRSGKVWHDAKAAVVELLVGASPLKGIDKMPPCLVADCLTPEGQARRMMTRTLRHAFDGGPSRDVVADTRRLQRFANQLRHAPKPNA